MSACDIQTGGKQQKMATYRQAEISTIEVVRIKLIRLFFRKKRRQLRQIFPAFQNIWPSLFMSIFTVVC